MLKQLFDFLNVLKFDVEQLVNNPAVVSIKTGPFGLMVVAVEFVYKKNMYSTSVAIEKCEFEVLRYEQDYIVSLQKVILNKIRKEIE